MRKKLYTSEEIAKLKANPHTLQATSHRLQLTLKAKGKVLEMLEAGFTASKILRNLDYDTEMLGQASMDGLVYGVKKQARSAYGLQEGYKKRQGKHLESEDIGTLPVNSASKCIQDALIQLIALMQTSLIYKFSGSASFSDSRDG